MVAIITPFFLIIIMALLDTTAVSERIKYSVRSVQGVALILKIPKVKGSYLFTEEQAIQIETYLRSKNEKNLSTPANKKQGKN